MKNEVLIPQENKKEAVEFEAIIKEFNEKTQKDLLAFLQGVKFGMSFTGKTA
ncbi:MAG: hypothetical protein UFJ18_07100 [Blautia sp.]|nr:hypothetical protein [Blautia sp.]